METFASWNVPLPSHATTHEANLPINGSIYPVGGFETPIYVGSPPQRQLVQIDTGSSDLLVAQVRVYATPRSCRNATLTPTHHDRLAVPSAHRRSTIPPSLPHRAPCLATAQPSSARPAMALTTCASSTTLVCVKDKQTAACTDQHACSPVVVAAASFPPDETCNYADPTAFCSLLGTTYYDVVSVAPGSPISATVGLGGIREHQGAFDNEWTNMPGVMGMG